VVEEAVLAGGPLGEVAAATHALLVGGEVDWVGAIGHAQGLDGLDLDAGRDGVCRVFGGRLADCVDVVSREDGGVSEGKGREGGEKQESGAVHLGLGEMRDVAR